MAPGTQPPSSPQGQKNPSRGFRQRNHHGRGGRGRWNRGGNPRGGRGRGRNGFHHSGGRFNRQHHDRRGSNNNVNRGKIRYNPSAFDPIEEIGDVNCNNCTTNIARDKQNQGLTEQKVVRIAVEGCCHGELDLIYERLMDHEKTTGNLIDLLICCGDFQSLRSPSDFRSSSIPPKFQKLGDFCQYYSGERKAPILTIFIGGNHEASQPLRELYYGGWVAPKIYYLGACGFVRYRGIRIGGISGIYKSHDYTMGHHEQIPLDSRSLKSIYHVRNVDVERAKLMAKERKGKDVDNAKTKDPSKQQNSPVDVFVSHDWPLGIEQHGDTQNLIRRKPYFRQEIERNDLGSRPNRELLDVLKPKHWFSAHLHVKFHATVVHNKPLDTPDQTSTLRPTSSLLMPSQASSLAKKEKSVRRTEQADAIQALFAGQPNADDSNKEDSKGSLSKTNATSNKVADTTEFHGLETSTSNCVPSTGDEMEMNPVQDLTEQMTKFLALDKCLPRRQFLSILNLKVPDSEYFSETTETATGNAETKKEYRLEYDPEWLAILKNTHDWNQTHRGHVTIPPLQESCDANWVVQRFLERNEPLEIPESHFVATVPYWNDVAYRQPDCPPLPEMGNPQTDRLLDILELPHRLTVPYNASLTPTRISAMLQGKSISSVVAVDDDNEIDIDDEDVASDDGEPCQAMAKDDNEIDIDDASSNNHDSNEIDIDEEESEEDSTSVNVVAKKARLEHD